MQSLSRDEGYKNSSNLFGHLGYLTTLAMSRDGSLCAGGGREGIAPLCDLQERRNLYKLDAGGAI